MRGLRGTTGTRAAKETRGTRRTRGLRRIRWMRGLRKLMGLRRVRWVRGLTGLMWLLYIMIWLEHHGNRLYGVIRLLSKKWDGLDGYPLDCYDY